MLALLLACAVESDSKLYSGGDYTIVFNAVDDGCAGGDLAGVFVSGAAVMPAAASGNAAITLDGIGTATGQVEDLGSGALSLDSVEYGAVDVGGCTATLTVDIDLLIISADELAGTGTFDLAGCADFDADPCTVGADLSFVR